MMPIANQDINDKILDLQTLRDNNASQSQIATAIDNISMATNNANTLYAQEKQSESALPGQAMQILQSMNTTQPEATAYATALTHRVRYLGDVSHQLDASATASLQNIANECHIVYGASVFMSRSLLDAINADDTQYDDQQICTTTVPRQSKSDDVLTLDDITLYPNPVKNQLKIDTDKEIVSFTIFSIDGKLMKTGNITNQIIDVADLRVGMHFVRLLGQDGIEYNLSFVKN